MIKWELWISVSYHPTLTASSPHGIANVSVIPRLRYVHRAYTPELPTLHPPFSRQLCATTLRS